MFEETIKSMRESDDFKEDIDRLIEKRAFEELPNHYTKILEVLANDEKGKALLETSTKHMRESTDGKISLRKRTGEEEMVTVNMYDGKDLISESSLSSINTDKETDYKAEDVNYQQLKDSAVNYEEQKAQIGEELNRDKIY